MPFRVPSCGAVVVAAVCVSIKLAAAGMDQSWQERDVGAVQFDGPWWSYLLAVAALFGLLYFVARFQMKAMLLILGLIVVLTVFSWFE